MSPERPPTPSTPECFGREKTPTELVPATTELVPATTSPILAGDGSEKEEVESSGSSPASFVYQDHCYSLPPQEEPHLRGSLSPSEAAIGHEDHGYTKAEPEIPAKKLKNVRIAKPKVILL